MQRLRRLSLLTLLLVTPCQAQRLAASDRGSDPLAILSRAVPFIGQAAAAVPDAWRLRRDPVASRATLRVTAADQVMLLFGVDAAGRDTTQRVVGARMVRVFADTAALRSAVAQTLQQLFTRNGAPTACTEPLGSPSHLYVPQRVSRVWAEGVQRAPTVLAWTITKDGLPELELTVGPSAAENLATLPCNAPMP